MALTDTLAAAGAAALGGSMPLLAPSWLSGATPTVNADGLTLASGGSAWLAPLAGYTRTAAQAASRSGVFLRRPDGSQVPSNASVLSLYPQQYLRLARLYALILEGTGRSEAARGQSARPVPAHLVLPAGVAEGGVDPGDTLIAGTL